MDRKTIMHFHPPTEEELASSLYVTWAGKRKWNSGEYIGFKMVDIHVLVYVVSGKGTIVQGNGDAFPVESGAAFVIFPGIRFRFVADAGDPWEFCWISFGGSKVQKILSDIGISKERYIVCDLPGTVAQAVTSLYDSRGSGEMDVLAAVGCLLMLFAEMGRQQAGHHKKGDTRTDIVPMAVRFIESYYFMHLDVDMICDYVRYSRSYLSRLFNNELKMTIPEYINQVRIRHAKELFEQTMLSVQEVSASVGIADSFYFSKSFKKAVGMSPNQYKKQYGLLAKQAEMESIRSGAEK